MLTDVYTLYEEFAADVAAGRVEDWDTKPSRDHEILYIRGRLVATIRRRGRGDWEWERFPISDQAGYGLPTYDAALDECLAALNAGKCSPRQYQDWYGH